MEGNTESFEDLFDLVHSVPWKSLLPARYPISVRAVSEKSVLTSLPSIQRTAKKGIVESLVGKSGVLAEDESLGETGVLILIRENYCRILLETTGEPLHKRGYRKEAGEAPIKETLAAGLVILAKWRYGEPFYDIFCGSGTIAIEAAMIARNIAPGLQRSFAFERFPWIPKSVLEEAKARAEAKIMRDKQYTIIASDRDAELIRIAEENAKRAGVADDIAFYVKDAAAYTQEEMHGTLVSNPPYGERLSPADLDDIYKNIALIFRKNKTLFGGVITSYPDFTVHLKGAGEWKNRKLRNGSEEVRWLFRGV